MSYKKLVAHVESHASTVSLLKQVENSAMNNSDHQTVGVAILTFLEFLFQHLIKG